MSLKLQRLLEERRKRNFKPSDLLLNTFKQQRDFILDPATRKFAIVSRRSGKSYGEGIDLIYTALSFNRVKLLYFCKTQETARNVMWLHIMLPILEMHQIRYKYNKTRQEITFENQSVIKLTGADATEHQIEKVLGGKYKKIVFDECQIIQNDLQRWIEHRLGPAMIDQNGTICMLGTSGDYMGDHYWYNTTKLENPTPGWSGHRWTWADNPHMAHAVQKELDKLTKLDKDFINSIGYKQEWLCEWVVETSARVYKYDQTKNALKDEEIIKSIKNKDPEWKFVIGLDFGFNDATALVVGAYSKFRPECYIVDSIKKTDLLTHQTAELLMEWREKYKPVLMVGDAQNLTLVEDLRTTYRIPIVAAKKLGKEMHIASMNSDFRRGMIRVIEQNNRALIKEWDELVWNEKQRMKGFYTEDSSKDNHAADACLYLHHGSFHYRSIERPVDPHYSDMRKAAEKELQDQLNQTHNTEIYDQLEKGLQ